FILMFTWGCSLPTGLRDRIRDAVLNSMDATPAPANSTQQSGTPAAQKTPADDLEGWITALTGEKANLPDNYRSTFSMTSEGTDPAGSAFTQVVEVQSEIIRPDNVQHSSLRYDGSGVFSQTGSLELYRQDDQLYVYSPHNPNFPCALVKSTDTALDGLMLDPQAVIQTLEIGELLEADVLVNEIPADHYTVQTANLQTDSSIFEDGEVWIARDGGYVVRFTGSAKASPDTQQSAVSAALEWDYNVYDPGEVAGITVPEVCLNRQSAVDEIPIPDSALNPETFGGIVTFTTVAKPDSMADFYRQSLPPLGWVLTDDLETGGVILLTAQKDDLDLQVMITPEANGSSLILTTITMK
ncbi:MAG: hypothetical protein AAGU05_09750, partial [Anaerolineaceae bacterium]